MRRKNDQLWKGMIEEIFDDLLRFIFPVADQVFDMQRGFEFLDKELNEMYPEPDKDPDTRFVDKLVKVFRLDGHEEWLLVHIEVQGHADKQFPERMFRYYYRIFDRYQKPITAIAIFTGPNGRNMPGRYAYHFLGTSLTYEYNTFCITDPADEALAASENPFAMVVLAARKALLAGKIPERALLDQKLLVARLLLGKEKYSRRKIDMILVFLRNYILFEDRQTNIIFDKQIDKITNKTHTMGLIEQITEMRVQETQEAERKQFVTNLLLNSDHSVEEIASFAGVSVSFVEEVKEGLCTK
jgi:predicted transposase YdaD